MYLYCAIKIVCSTIVHFRKSNPSLEKPLMTFFIDAAVNPIFKFMISKLLAFLFDPAAIHAQALPKQTTESLHKIMSKPMKLNIFCFVVLQLAFIIPSPAQADTHPPLVGKVIHQAPKSSCLVKDDAEGQAKDLAVTSAKSYFRSEGFGWRSSSVKDLGSLDCHRCGDDHYSCGYSNISFECRKANPQLSLSEWFSASR